MAEVAGTGFTNPTQYNLAVLLFMAYFLSLLFPVGVWLSKFKLWATNMCLMPAPFNPGDLDSYWGTDACVYNFIKS